jgi:small GTP-binding protein
MTEGEKWGRINYPCSAIFGMKEEIATYKIVVVGASGVGKTAIVQRLVDNTFAEDCQATVGVEFKTHAVSTDGKLIKLNIWDTAGQERFRSVSKAYFRNAVGAILVFAIDDHTSFEALDSWLTDLNLLAAQNAVVLLVGNKSDQTERMVTSDEAQNYAARQHMTFLETSAKDGTGIEEAFVRLAKAIHEKVLKHEIVGQFTATTAPPIHRSTLGGVRRPGKSGCC